MCLSWCTDTTTNVTRNVGFLRYWKVSNIPLFLLAMPMFTILVASGLWALTLDPKQTLKLNKTSQKNGNGVENTPTSDFLIFRNLGVSQLLLTLLTLTTAHVQIITRVSSAYPVWLWYAAVAIQSGSDWSGRFIVPFVVMYSILQGGLFASFLPPA